MNQKSAALNRIARAALSHPQTSQEETLSLYDAIHAGLEHDCPELAQLAGTAATAIRQANFTQIELFQFSQKPA